jgi:hypothetical protein
MSATLFFITHPEVAVDASIPVTSGSLSEAGRVRIRAFVTGGAAATAVRWRWDESLCADVVDLERAVLEEHP